MAPVGRPAGAGGRRSSLRLLVVLVTSAVAGIAATAPSFEDVPPEYWAAPWIEALAAAAVTGGCAASPPRYCPESPVIRQEMAVFLLKAHDGGGYVPPPCTTPRFVDVPCSDPFAAWIEELAVRSVAAGCGAGQYCPDRPVTREEMAGFLLKMLEGPGFAPPPCTTPRFVDVPCANVFAPWIQELVTRSIAAGCDTERYCPADPVTRAQMAVFLVKSLLASPRTVLQLDGLTAYVEVPTSPDFSVSALGLSVSAWMRADTLVFPKTEGSLANEQYVHWLGKGQAAQHEWAFRMYSDPANPRANRLSFYVFNLTGGRGCGSYFQDPITPGRWVHVVGVVDRATQQVSIYKNGLLRRATSFAGIISPAPATAPLRMGTRDFASFLQGALGRVRLWNRPLSASEVQALYADEVVPPDGLVAEYLLNEGVGAMAHDTSGHAHHGTLVGARWGVDGVPIMNLPSGSSGGGC
jgi:hypothetical protein